MFFLVTRVPGGATFALFLLLIMVRVASAGSISFGELDFTNPVLAIGGSTFVSVPANTTAGQYTLGASLTLSNDVLDLNSVQIVCSNPGLGGVCGPVDLEFQALSAVAAGDSLLVDATLSGTGSASGFARVCIADTQHICSSDGSGSESITIPFSGLISGSGSSGFTLAGGFDLLGDFHLDGLAGNSSVSLGDSFSISMAVAAADMGGGGGSAGPPVPEPATFAPMLLGVIALLRVRKGTPKQVV